ncbi:MAG: tetratricopeptide repeat protein [Thermodesulfobacteriota bacterium]|nr:tetratricopeptide repeat protein [Thermodesulfobacteriota bacterium]
MRLFKLATVFLPIFLLFTGSLSGAEYVAFSLKVARDRIKSTPAGLDYRNVHPDVFVLGGITGTRGLVHDKDEMDVIIVGERDTGRSPLTMDDVVVALRARFIHAKWPVVSIDMPPGERTTEKYVVRYRGGIENTQFGKDLLDADCTLKKMIIGLLPSEIPELKTHRQPNTKGIEEDAYRAYCRLWLFALPPFVSVLEDLVTVRGFEARLFSEPLLRRTDGNSEGDECGIGNDIYERLSGLYPCFSRLRGFCELIGLSKALSEMEIMLDLTFFLDEYRVKKIETKSEIEIPKRRKETRRCEWAGVKLIGPSIRPGTGDCEPLRKAVLNARPGADELNWRFVSKGWAKPIRNGVSEKMEKIVPLLTEAAFLEESKRFDAAVVLYDKIIECAPDWSWAYYGRGLACYYRGIYDRAISNYTQALKLQPRFFEAYNNRGLAHYRKGLYDQAISDYTQSLNINPRHGAAYNNRGAAHHDKGLYDLAISDYTQALRKVPRYADAYNNRGAAYHDRGLFDRAISDYTEALKINPGDCETYFNKANAYEEIGQIKKAIEAYRNFVKYAPPEYGLYIEQAKKRIRELEKESENDEEKISL